MLVRSLLLALPLAVGAGCSTTQSASSGSAAVSGTVTHVTSDSIAVESADGRERTLAVVPQTQFSIDGRNGTVADVRPGADVRAAYDTDASGRKVALRVATVPASPEESWATGGMHGGSGGAPPVGRSASTSSAGMGGLVRQR